MTRTKEITRALKYNKQEEPIVLSKPLLDLLLKQPNPADLISVYSYYYYTAKWQQTNQPKATVNYVAQGLGISPARVRQAKKVLIDLGLIEEITERNESCIIGHYIRIRFVWSYKTYPLESLRVGVYPLDSLTLENLKGNALSSSNINSPPKKKGGESEINKKFSPKKIRTKNSNKTYLPIAQRLSHMIRTQRNVKISTTKLKQWANELRKLETQDGVTKERMLKIMKWYQKNYGREFIPIAESGRSFRDKFIRIEDAMKRDAKKKSSTRCPEGLEWGNYAKKGCNSSGCPDSEKCYAKRQQGKNPL